MRILLLTQWFDPEPTFKGLIFAKALQKAGHEVEVVTGFPNYPGGKIYPGYKVRWRQKEEVDGIKVTRVFLFPSHNSSAIKRILNYLSFAISACIYGVFSIKKVDIIYAYHPPITIGLAAAIIGLVRRIPFVLDIQDLWPDTLHATGMINNSHLLGIIAKLCQWVYCRAKHIVVLSPGFRNLLINRKVPAAKIDVIYNWANEQLLFSHNKPSFELDTVNRFNVVFAGNMGKAQALDAVLLAAKQVEQVNNKIQFVFVGGGVEVGRLKQLAQEQQIGNVTFLPQMPMSEIGGILQAANVLLVHLKDDPLFEITIPSKIQAYLTIGKPILVAVKGDAADLVVQAKAGYCAQPENIDSIVKAILKMAALSIENLNEIGLNGKNFYYKNLSLSIGSGKFLNIFNKIIDKIK